MSRSRSRSYSVDPRDLKRAREASRSRSRSVPRSEYYTSSSMAPLLQQQPLSAIDPEEFIRLRAECAELEQRLNEYQNEMQVSQEVWYKQAEDFNSKLIRAGKTITSLLVEQAKREFVEMRKQLIANQERLGEYGIIEGNHRGWKGGSEEESINNAQYQYELDKADIDREKAASRKLRKSTMSVIGSSTSAFLCSSSANNSNSGKENNSNVPGSALSSHNRIIMDATETELLLLDTRESTSMGESILKRTEEQIKERRLKLQADRISYMKQLKTHQAQEKSTFNKYERYGQMERYQLLNMLGKGGFSEVYKAYDLFTHCFVAIKIHQIHTNMDEIARQNYVQHTTMEYNIHKRLKHRRIVRLMDCFAIDVTSFGVAIEYCEGLDLDTYLKAHGPMSEKEARGVIVQVLSALRYLNTAPNKIIHYDLKPGNILYNKGSVKIADFGLSKIVDHSLTNGHDTIELTSQGAGTYYYLPPECFSTATAAHQQTQQLKVSNKVDVWSVGVVFYELIFARKPFGDGQTQEHILRSASTIFNPNGEIQFPGKISKQAEEFIRRLLTYDARRRPDVLEASVDPYVFPSAAVIGSMMISSTPK